MARAASIRDRSNSAPPPWRRWANVFVAWARLSRTAASSAAAAFTASSGGAGGAATTSATGRRPREPGGRGSRGLRVHLAGESLGCVAERADQIVEPLADRLGVPEPG